MARKFLQMGYTRAKRYANYKGGKKFDKSNNYKLNFRGTGGLLKHKSAAIFYRCWRKAVVHPEYLKLKIAWKEKYDTYDKKKRTC